MRGGEGVSLKCRKYQDAEVGKRSKEWIKKEVTDRKKAERSGK